MKHWITFDARGDYADPAKSPKPGIVLLDLNLPGTDGREVLAEIKRDDGLKGILVAVVTTSSHDRVSTRPPSRVFRKCS